MPSSWAALQCEELEPSLTTSSREQEAGQDHTEQAESLPPLDPHGVVKDSSGCDRLRARFTHPGPPVPVILLLISAS